jgi:DNA-binding NarL/FixJ family response regulator
LRAGAAGYLCKDNAESQLEAAIRKVAGGGLYINQTVAERLAQEMVGGKTAVLPHTQLSDREYEVFRDIAAGLGVTEIGQRLNLSVKTVSTHKARIMQKMGFANTAELIQYAMKHNLLDQAG